MQLGRALTSLPSTASLSRKKKKKYKERFDYDAIFGEEMIKRITKMGFKLVSYGDVGNGRVRLNFTKK